MIDPEVARRVLREYHETTPIEKQIEDTRRIAPALAERLGLNEPFTPHSSHPARNLRTLFASFGRSVHKLFS